MTTPTPTIATSHYRSARNPKGKKPVSDAALANENQRVNVPYDANAWEHLSFLTEPDRSLLRWFHQDVLDRNFDRNRVGEILGAVRGKPYDSTTAYRLLKGTLQVADWSHFLGAIVHYQGSLNDRTHVAGTRIRPDFVETPPSVMFGDALDYAARGGFSIVAAPSGWGKTTTLEQWDHSNRGRMLRFDYPSIGSYAAMIHELADIMGVGWLNASAPSILNKILKRLSSDTLIVVDQGTRMIPPNRKIHDQSFEILTDINKVCGVLVALTWRDMAEFEHARYQIEQVTGRAEIFATPPLRREDVDAISSQFGKLSAATVSALYELAKQHGGLRNVVTVLDVAHRFAGSYNKPINDDHVKQAIDDRFKRLPTGETPFGEELKGAQRK